MNRKIENIRVKQHALGIVPDKPRRAYDAVEYLNPSSIAAGIVDHLEIDPAAIKWAFENPSNGHAAAAQDRMDRGTLAHMMLLQPGRVAKDVAIWTGGTRKGAAWDDFSAQSVGKLIVREQDYDAVTAAVEQFRFQKRICELLTDLDAEVAMFSREHSFYVKGLVDAVTNEIEGVDGPFRRIIDLKTTDAGINERQVERTIRDFRNREKMAAYRRWYARESGYPIEQIRCMNLFLSMTPPYAVRIVDIPSITLDWGERRIVEALDRVQKCLDQNTWPMLVASGESLVESWEEEEPEITIGGLR